MLRPCKLCDTLDSSFSLHAEVCDDCFRYDWGHWRWRQVSWVGGLTGFSIALVWALFSGALHSFASSGLAAFFVAVLGALVGWALTEVVVDLLLNRALLHSPPNQAPGERAREAEKFFYIGLLSAYQGKTRFALRMLALARSHGWRRWERLTTDPRLTPLARCAFERALIKPASE